MSSKEFLRQECKNIKDVLEETLRFKYGLDGSKEFFEECETRRTFIESEINNVPESDYSSLEDIGININELSGLISRIERSSLGEYSWPFVEELKKIAIAVCRESTLIGNDTPPKVYVLSDGGLDAYRIYTEPNRPRVSRRRILTIVFPRTLKYFVLLHPILGHEVGHAIWRCSKLQYELKKIVQEELIDSGGKFESPASTASWIYDKNSPLAIKNYLSFLSKHGINDANLFHWADWEAWKEEILCDLIGLLSFGPSFVAAHCELLYALAPTGASFGDEHPPVGSRIKMVIRAANLLGYNDTSGLSDGDYKEGVNKFWTNLDARKQDDPWYDIFSDQQLISVMERISTLLGQYPPALYQETTPEVLSALFNKVQKQVPPVGYEINEDGLGICKKVDFRNILYVGWIAKQQIPDMPFLKLNQLCEYAILQQRGIDIFLDGV